MSNTTPHADFTPVMKGYTGQGAFRFWCQAVLPLVYDDSLSYYELLNKVVIYLNNTIQDVANMEDNVDALHEAYVSLQDYVNTYFDNLDFPAEVERVLDQMAADGTLTALVAPLLPTIIGDWLTEHITPTTPPVDDTLTIPNAAADSQAVGLMFNKAMVSRSQIGDGDNLDDYYSISGMYYCSRETSTTIENGPWSNVPFVLFVRSGSTDSATSGQVQYAFDKNGGFAYRFRYTSNWGEWNYAANEEANPFVMMTRGSVSANDDLNEYYQYSGMYYCTRVASQSVGNSPWNNDNYVLYVKNATEVTARSGQAQFAFTDSGKFAIRMRYLDTWGDWKYFENEETAFKTMTTRGTISGTDNLNNFYTSSGMWYCNRDNSLTAFNTPWTDAPFALFVKSATTQEAESGQVQYAISFYGHLAWRFRYGGSWGTWHYAMDNTDDRLIMKTRGSISANSDLDDYYADSGMWYASSGVAGSSSNVPWDDLAFSLLVKASSTSTSQSGQIQIAMNVKGDMAIRARFVQKWTEWIYISSRFENVYFTLSLFSKIGVMGASYDCGSSAKVDGSGSVQNRNNSWLKLLGKEYGFTDAVYAWPGTSIQTWFDPTWEGYSYCYGAFASDTACDLYFITLGGNGTIDGSLADCAAFDADPSSTPTTFYGYYAKLIYTILQKAPDCKIVMCYPASAGLRGPLTDAKEAIAEIAEYYELPLLDLTRNAVWRRFAESFCAARTGGGLHPTPYGYALLAQCYNEVFSNVLINNAAYFNTWRNIP